MTGAFGSNRLAWRLSLALFTILLTVGVAYVWLTARSAKEYYQETTQRLHAHVARHMLLEVEPFLDGAVNEAAVGQIMHAMMAVNPLLEVYLLSSEGEILSYVVLDEEVESQRIDTKPLIDFVKSNGTYFVLGDDPKNPSQKAVFSAAEVIVDEQMMGYVYMILATGECSGMADVFASSNFLKMAGATFLTTLLLAFLIGIGLIHMLTRHLRRVVHAVKRFASGDYQARISLNRNDEWRILGNNFNDMADTIVQNMDALRHVDNLRKELVANISHDLRSPISIIHGYAETLTIKFETLSDPEKLAYLHIMMRNTNRLNKMVSDLFELTRLESNLISLQPVKFAITPFITSLIDEYQLKARARDIFLDIELPKDLPTVHADPTLLERVLQNLMENALKFTPTNGTISIDLKVDSGSLIISISNTGPGISDADLPFLFDRYYKVAQADHQSKSTGLGLAIVKRIMDMHRAIISVSSKENELTTFKLIFPHA